MNDDGTNETDPAFVATHMEIEGADDPEDVEAGDEPECPVCFHRRSRPDIRAFDCAEGAHPAPMCGTCTRNALRAEHTACPLCRAPVRGWIPVGDA